MAVVSTENLKLANLDARLREFIYQNEDKVAETETKVHLVQLVLRGKRGERDKVHHFPADRPFIGAKLLCASGKVAVFYLERKKMALVDGCDIASETNVGNDFTIDNVQYVFDGEKDGFPSYKPVFKK